MVGATTKTEILLRNREVAVNRGIVKRVGIRGHRIDDSEANKGNFLESLKNRFEKNQLLLEAFTLFAPSRFQQLVKNFKTSHDLQACLNTYL